MFSNPFLQEVSEAFSSVSDKRELFELVIGFGDDLPVLPLPERSPDLFVKGCLSDVFVKADFSDNRVFFSGWADSLIVRGYLSIILNSLNVSSVDPLITISELKRFAESFDFVSSGVPSRADSFLRIVSFCENLLKN